MQPSLLRSVIAQCRNFSTVSRRSLTSSRRSNESKRATRRVVAGDGSDKFDDFLSSLVFGHCAFLVSECIQILEYRRTFLRDMEERRNGVSIMATLHDLRDWFFND